MIPKFESVEERKHYLKLKYENQKIRVLRNIQILRELEAKLKHMDNLKRCN